ncbi:MAG: Gmad2 immunoglobulin-like domain-containing protein [Acidimicrobiia bacterium]
MAVALIIVATVGCGSGSRSTPSGSTSTPTRVRSTVQPFTAVWPFAASRTRYSDPAAAARAFAVTYLGFVDPVVGRFRQGDSRSGEIVIKPMSSGPETTVTVRKLAPDETWWVLAASTPNLQLASPTATESVTSPVTLSGTSTAFEGTVSVEIRQDGTLTPLTTGFVTGGANGQIGPFSKAITFPTPTADGGSVVLKTFGTENNVLWEASVVRLRFATK